MKPLLIFFLLIYAGNLFAAEPEGEALSVAPLVEARDLFIDGQAAQSNGQVILLLVSQEYCSFCEQIKREVIRPIIRSGSYDNRLMIRELMLDGGSDIVDFEGNQQESQAFAFGYRVGLTPTLLFLSPNGQELAPKMVGIQTPEMYYYYVDESIQQALQTLKQTIN